MSKKIKQVAISALVASSITASLFTIAELASTEAHADVASGCVDDFHFIWFQSTRRVICDGPIRPDGSWLRARVFYTPAHQVPFTCNTYGSYNYSSTSCSGGYYQQEIDQPTETYIVNNDTILPDEPGHLIGNN